MTTTVPLVVIPDDETDGAAAASIEAVVNGQRRLFLLDTGAASSRTGAAPLPSPCASRSPSTHTSGRGALGPASSRAGTVGVATMTIGTQGEPVQIDDLAMERADPALPGPPDILGLDALGRFRIDVRYRSGELVINDPTPQPRPEPLVLSSHRHPHVEVSWRGVRATALIDTGAGVSVVDTAFAAAHPDLVAVTGSEKGTDAYGTTLETPIGRLDAVSIAGRTFRPSLAAIAPIRGIQPAGDPDFELILGHPLLAQVDWSLDFLQHTWSFLDREPAAR